MKPVGTILFILGTVCLRTWAELVTPPTNQGRTKSVKDDNVMRLIRNLQKRLDEVEKERQADRELIQELSDKVRHQHKAFGKLRQEVHFINEQQGKNTEQLKTLKRLADIHSMTLFNVTASHTIFQSDLRALQNIQKKFNDEFVTLQQKVLEAEQEKQNFSGAVHDMDVEIKDIRESIRTQKSDLDQLQVTFKQVIEADLGKSQENERSENSGEKVFLNDIPILDETAGSGDFDIPEVVTSGTPHTEQTYTSTDDVVDPTNNGILHIFPSDFVEKFLKQAQDISHLQVNVTDLSSTVKTLEDKYIVQQQETVQSSMRLFQETFSNLTQQMLTIQQWNIANGPYINNTFSNQKEIDKLLGMIIETKEEINNLVKDSFDQKIDNEDRISKMDSKVIQVNKTVNTVLRRLGLYKERTRGTHGNLEDKILEVKEKNSKLLQRLEHVEVKVLNASLQKCMKKNLDRDQDKQISNLIKDIQVLISVTEKQKRDYRRLQRSVEKCDLLSDQNEKVMGNLLGLTKNLTIHIPALLDMKVEVEAFIEHLPLDCTEEYHKGIRHTGIYLIRPLEQEGSVSVYCDMDQDDGWTIIQRRTDGSTDFNQDWVDYKYGFGETRGDYWLGNDNLYFLTKQDDYMLQIDMWDTDGQYWYALYGEFYLTNEEDDFTLTVNNFTGNATDALSYSSGMKFGTTDVDNDASSTHCAVFYTAGWWYKHCQYCNLNGRFDIGMVWFNYDRNEWMHMRKSVMRIKPRNSGGKWGEDRYIWQRKEVSKTTLGLMKETDPTTEGSGQGVDQTTFGPTDKIVQTTFGTDQFVDQTTEGSGEIVDQTTLGPTTSGIDQTTDDSGQTVDQTTFGPTDKTVQPTFGTDQVVDQTTEGSGRTVHQTTFRPNVGVVKTTLGPTTVGIDQTTEGSGEVVGRTTFGPTQGGVPTDLGSSSQQTTSQTILGQATEVDQATWGSTKDEQTTLEPLTVKTTLRLQTGSAQTTLGQKRNVHKTTLRSTKGVHMTTLKPNTEVDQATMGPTKGADQTTVGSSAGTRQTGTGRDNLGAGNDATTLRPQKGKLTTEQSGKGLDETGLGSDNKVKTTTIPIKKDFEGIDYDQEISAENDRWSGSGDA